MNFNTRFLVGLDFTTRALWGGVLFALATCMPTSAAAQVTAWGNNSSGQLTAPSGLAGVSAISEGANFSLALLNNGTVVGWGDDSFGETTIPAGLHGVIAVSAGATHSLALLDNGTVVAWGDNGAGEATVPTGLSEVIAVSAGSHFSLALLANGTVVAWGIPMAKPRFRQD